MTNLEERYLKAKKRLLLKYYGSKLNSEQCRAVFTVNGPLLVLAGAGSGKTTVLVNRIAYIIKYGNAYFNTYVPTDLTEEYVMALEGACELSESEIEEILPDFADSPTPPWAVLAITFTNKAAREIKDRISAVFSDPTVSDSIWSGTFHSVCLRILRKFASRLGYKDGFSIYDTDDKKRLIAICMKELNIDEKRLQPRAVASAISMAKDSLISPEDFEITSDPRTKDIKKVYAAYQKKIFEYNAVDFDDIIMKTVELLKADSEVRDYYQNKFRHVLVDEYQDTNYAQFVLTKLLSDKYRNIMVVGDDDQSIYRFRGATVENILNFDKTYPDATVVKLEQNYRSTKNILAAANAVIKNNNMRHDKKLWCDKDEGELIVLHSAENQSDEGKYIIDKINKEVKDNGRRYSDFAILYRVNELARSLETTFAKSGFPYKILGSMRFYDRKEIKDIIAYLSVISSSSDDLRLKRIINEPKRKIGQATVDAVEEIASLEGVSMYDVMRQADKYVSLSKSASKLSDFACLMEKIKSENEKPSELISAIFNETGYRAMLVAEGFEGEGKINNVEEFISAGVEYEKRCKDAETEPTLEGFLEEIALVSDVDKYDESADSVVLMTIHSAKGLEFPVVFIAGMEDGIFPSQQNIFSVEEMSEERRLAYVAVTRAREKLYITYTKERTMYGRTSYNMLSQFVREEIPDSLIERDNPRRASSRFDIKRRERERVPRDSELYRQSGFERQKKGAERFGVERIAQGSRVSHAMFGDGVIVSARDMGADILYEVKFDTGATKKLMATYAKLKKI